MVGRAFLALGAAYLLAHVAIHIAGLTPDQLIDAIRQRI